MYKSIFIILITFIGFFSCTTTQQNVENNENLEKTAKEYKTIDEETSNNIENESNIKTDIFKFKKIFYYHIEPAKSFKKGERIEAGETVGYIQPWPDIISDYNNQTLQDAITLYNEKNYEECFKTLEKIFHQEKENPFFIYLSAKLFYWYEGYKQASFEYFLELQRILDEKYEKSFEKIIIDAWFPELYWKLGCLYLDQEMWLEAAKEITKFLLLHQYNDSPAIEQAYSYITEAFYFLNDKDSFDFYFKKTLEKYPNNEYILQFN